MARSLPPLNAVRAFEAAGRLGSFKAAAAELGVTHGAVSQQIRLLEDHLGAPLFERHNRRILLTPSGRVYLGEVGPALERVASATSKYGEVAASVLRVNAPATFALRWLVPKLTEFQEQYPWIKVRLETSGISIDALSEQADVIIRGGPDAFHDYQVRPFLSEKRLPVCSPAVLNRLPLRQPGDLSRHTLLHTLSVPRLWQDWLAKAGVPALEADADLVLDHFYLTLQAARDGVGVAMGPTALMAEDLEAGLLVMPFATLSLRARSYCTYVPEALANDSRILALRSWLERHGNIHGSPD